MMNRKLLRATRPDVYTSEDLTQMRSRLLYVARARVLSRDSWGLSAGLTTLPHKKLVTETSIKETLLSLRGRGPPLENARTLCGESRKEATSQMPIDQGNFKSRNLEREDHV